MITSALQLSSPALAAVHTSGGKWQMTRHLAAIDRVVTAAILTGGGPRILILEAPPRHGKSEYISKRLPPWYLGTHPTKRVILTSYESNFARSWGRKARDIVQEHGHLYGVAVSKGQSAANNWEIDKYGGGMSTAGVGGSLTGWGADLLIVDDPIKNAEESLSDYRRESQWDWWQSTASTRIEPGGLAIVMATRWHADDLSGRLIAAAESGEGDPVLRVRLPAIAETDDYLGRQPGEALWPQRWPIGKLEQRKSAVSGYWWSALYQQSPGRHGSMEWPDAYFAEHIWAIG